MRHLNTVLAATAIAFASYSLPAAAGNAPGAQARIQDDMAYLADDARNGRETGSPGYEDAAEFVLGRMKDAGLKAAAKRVWRQEVPLRSAVREEGAAKMSLLSDAGETQLVALDDFMTGFDYNNTAFDVTAPLVFAGHGVIAPEDGIDDYAGLDVAGKIVIVLSDAQKSLDGEKRAYYSSGRTKSAIAAEHGAIGMISIFNADDAARVPWARVTAGVGRASMTTIGPDGRAETSAPGLTATATMSPAGGAKLFAGETMEYAALQKEAAEGNVRGFNLSKKVRIAGANKLSDTRSPNIIGVIEGSDRRLRNEVVLMTAHLDHIGVSSSAKEGEDAINNGALDNAGGVAVLLEAARMFSSPGVRPKRTVAFVALTGEEKGLLGSGYLARHPAFGGRRVVSNVNLDMPVALYPFTDVIAFGAERSSIGPLVEAVAADMSITLSPDPMPQENIFIRSDHFSFVREGVPAVFLVPGWANGGEKAFTEFLKTHYHRPSDDMSLPIDFDALARFADLNYRIVRALADAPAAPVWAAGDFFGEKFSK